MTRARDPRATRWWQWAALAAGFALVTANTGWTAVVPLAVGVAAVDGFYDLRSRPAGYGLAAALGWAALLARAAAGPGFGDVTRTLGGLAGLSPAVAGVVAAVLTLALAAALAWPAAALGILAGRALRHLRRRAAPPAAAPSGAVTLDPLGPPAAPSGAPLGTSAAAPP